MVGTEPAQGPASGSVGRDGFPTLGALAAAVDKAKAALGFPVTTGNG